MSISAQSHEDIGTQLEEESIEELTANVEVPPDMPPDMRRDLIDYGIHERRSTTNLVARNDQKIKYEHWSIGWYKTSSPERLALPRKALNPRVSDIYIYQVVVSKEIREVQIWECVSIGHGNMDPKWNTIEQGVRKVLQGNLRELRMDKSGHPYWKKLS